jgi:transcriptional regulator with XRE-family HTH domain
MTAIKQARLLAGLSFRQAASVVGVNLTTILKYERPTKKRYDSEILGRMADAYGKRIDGGLTVDQLLGRAPLPEAAHEPA